MSGFTPEPMETVGDRSHKEIQHMLRSGYKRITFTSQDEEALYEIDYDQMYSAPFVLQISDRVNNDWHIIHKAIYQSITELLEAHPLDLSRFEISN